ncbi:cytochrome b561 domain-containing protein At2g30890-like [Aristolochia californica]|uniref:cytochrome b561 domain-containing protein At2g30890-like n=1 Tax=Aristolochia californica TaxID=171875 RepID=UPI0035D5BD37
MQIGYYFRRLRVSAERVGGDLRQIDRAGVGRTSCCNIELEAAEHLGLSENKEMPSFWRLRLLAIFSSLILLAVLPSVSSSRELEKLSSHKHNKGSTTKLGSELSFQITLHGFLLWSSMGFLMPVGILIIRMSTREQCGKRLKILFYSHVISQVASILLATVGAVLSIKNFENSFSNTHQRIGLALYCVILLQPVIGFCRPHRGVKGRSRWYFVHWALGTGVSLLGILNIYTGLHAYHRRTGRDVGLWTLLFSVEVSLIAFLYLLQDKWDYMKKQGEILGEEPVAPSDQIPASRENSKELAVPCYESMKFRF